MVARKGDPVAGQIWIEIDHLDGTWSLYSPAPSVLVSDDSDWSFQPRFERVQRDKVSDRLAKEAEYDPDFWVISLDMRGDEFGFETVI